jgi:hypothetical protein
MRDKEAVVVLGVLAGAKNPTGQTVSLKKVFLRKHDFFIFSHSLLFCCKQ